MANEPSVRLVGDLSKITAEEIAAQIRAVCEANSLRVKVDPLSLTQEQKVVRLFDGTVEVGALYPAGTHDNKRVVLSLPESGASLPFGLEPLVDQLTGQSSEPAEKKRSWFGGLFR
jgi:hypothetical protein